jgi:phage tail-like protein
MRLDRLGRLLPEVFQRTITPESPLFALLAVMEELHRPSEEVLANLDAFFDPRRTPERFVSYLASWVDLDVAVAIGPDRARGLVAEMVALSRLRGTRKALVRFLTVATGIPGFEIDEKPFHIVVRMPAASLPYENVVRKIIELEKPAHVTYELAKPAP